MCFFRIIARREISNEIFKKSTRMEHQASMEADCTVLVFPRGVDPNSRCSTSRCLFYTASESCSIKITVSNFSVIRLHLEDERVQEKCKICTVSPHVGTFFSYFSRSSYFNRSWRFSYLRILAIVFAVGFCDGLVGLAKIARTNFYVRKKRMESELVSAIVAFNDFFTWT